MTSDYLRLQPVAGTDATTVAVRLPAGRITRRFACTCMLQQVRQWVASEADWMQLITIEFQLVSTHPRFVSRVENDHVTLIEAGLHPQAAFNFKLLENQAL